MSSRKPKPAPKAGRGASGARGLVVALLLAALAHACVAAQTRGRRRVPAPAAESFVGIEAIDFENYTYPLNGRSYKLIGGYYAGGAAQSAQWELRLAETPSYGDLTGDGRSEAVVVLGYGPVGGRTPSSCASTPYAGGGPRCSRPCRWRTRWTATSTTTSTSTRAS